METLKEASCVIPHSERHQFPSPRKKGPDAWHLFQCNPEDEVTKRMGTDIPVASSGNSQRIQIQLDKWPVTP